MDISRAKDVLDYWFSKGLYTADYDKWFMKSQDYDEEIKEKFGDLLKEAEKGKGYGWLVNKDSYVAYIILMDQFSRHIYRGTGDSFKNDNGVMIFVELGWELYKEELKGYEFMFAFMPYMHTENMIYQKKGEHHFFSHKQLYGNYPLGDKHKRKLTNPIHVSYMSSLDEVTNNDKEYEMLKSMESHVTGHQQTIIQFGRFPKRNEALGRESTPQEISYMERPEVKKRPY
tara:strand:- start:3182 stop:3868 length:687 start_codon:yes stop_codon:yes gene_type:complete